MIRNVVTRGFGNGTFAGTIPLVVTRGYTIGAAPLEVYYAPIVYASYFSQGTIHADTDSPLTIHVSFLTQLDIHASI